MVGVWKRGLVLPYRVDFEKVDEHYNRKLKLGRSGLIVLLGDGKNDVDVGKWGVFSRKYGEGEGQVYGLLVMKDNKDDALKFAKEYMKKN